MGDWLFLGFWPHHLEEASGCCQAPRGARRLVASSDLGPHQAEPRPQKAWPGLRRQKRQAAVGSDQVSCQNRNQEIVKSSSGRGESCQRPLYSPAHTPRPRVPAASQLGARASLELSLRSWLRLASRSLSSTSSWVRSVCASTRRDSLCSTAARADYQTARHPRQHPALPAPRASVHPAPAERIPCFCPMQSHCTEGTGAH